MSRSILDFNIMLVDSGPEPTLRELVHRYYSTNIYDEKLASAYAKQYCDAIEWEEQEREFD